MIGGQGAKGYYFIGFDQECNNFVYLDPHLINIYKKNVEYESFF